MSKEFEQQFINNENDLVCHHKLKQFDNYFSFVICSLISHSHAASPSSWASGVSAAIAQSEKYLPETFSSFGSRAVQKQEIFINFLRKFSRTRYCIEVCCLPNIIDVWAPAWGVLTKTFIGIVRYRRIPKCRPSSVCTWMKWRTKWKANT